MAKVYLDANTLIDLTEKRGNKNLALIFDQGEVYISPLSAHILFYSYKRKVPDTQATETLSHFHIVGLSKDILDHALEGPTPDLEDNIQLHSAAEAECDYFLTRDKNLLAMKFFGKARISTSLSN